MEGSLEKTDCIVLITRQSCCNGCVMDILIGSTQYQVISHCQDSVYRNVFFDPGLQFFLHCLHRTSSDLNRNLVKTFSSPVFKTSVIEVLIFSDLPYCSTSCQVWEVIGDPIVKGPWSTCTQSLLGLQYSVVEDKLPN